MKRVGVGMIGLGGAGSWGHFPGYLEIQDKARVVALCDTNPETMKEKAQLTDAHTYSDYEELLKNPEVDAVDICLPHFLHAPVAVAAAEARKHVMVEKPFTLTIEEADDVINAAKKNGVKLMVAENTRFVNAYEYASELVPSLGKISFLRTFIGGNGIASRLGNLTWRHRSETSGGGALFDGAVHSFYLMEWLAGKIDQINASTARLITEGPNELDDNTSGTVRFDSGAIGNFSATFTSQIPWTERLEIYGREASIVVDMLTERPVQIYTEKKTLPLGLDNSNHYHGSHSERLYARSVWEEPFIHHSPVDWKAASMRKEVHHFVNTILENKEPLVTGESGKRAVHLALQAYKSASKKMEVSV